AAGDRGVGGLQVRRLGTDHLRHVVARPAGGQRGRPAEYRRRGGHVGGQVTVGERVRVGDGQVVLLAGRAAGLARYPPGAAAPVGGDGQRVGAQRLDPVGDLLGRAV